MAGIWTRVNIVQTGSVVVLTHLVHYINIHDVAKYHCKPQVRLLSDKVSAGLDMHPEESLIHKECVSIVVSFASHCKCLHHAARIHLDLRAS